MIGGVIGQLRRRPFCVFLINQNKDSRERERERENYCDENKEYSN